MIGVCVHWFYGPHTTDGVVGKDNPLLLASNFSGRWPGLVGLLNTGACLESLGRALLARVDRRARLDDRRRASWSASTSGARTGRIRYAEDEIALPRAGLAPAAARSRATSPPRSARRRILILMLGDTSMGMINGYFGPRLLNRHGFTEHKVDQAWIIDRGRRIDEKRIDDALALREGEGRSPSTGGEGGADRLRRERDARAAPRLPRRARPRRRVQGRLPRLAVPARPHPAARRRRDFAEGLFNSTCRPEIERRHHRLRDRGRPGQRRPDGADEAAPARRRACTRR